MEDENKKERKGMKRTHNDAVRELVAFVRKRDKRLAAHQAEEAKRRMEREAEDKLRSITVLKTCVGINEPAGYCHALSLCVSCIRRAQCSVGLAAGMLSLLCCRT